MHNGIKTLTELF